MLVPRSMGGVWSGASTYATTPFGPQVAGGQYLVVSSPDADGSVYFRHTEDNQLFRVRGSTVQYCFNYAHPETPVVGSDAAPFTISASNDTALELCWRGPRLPSHAANCTGCACARWTLALDGSRLSSVFLQSPPAIHMAVQLNRSSHPVPSPESVRAGWDCEFSNYTGWANKTKEAGGAGGARRAVSPSPCPYSGPGSSAVSVPAPAHAVAQAGADGLVQNCVDINQFVRLEYVASQLPCWPCDVTFTIASRVPAGNYIAIGFKEPLAAYYGPDRVGEVDQYWGMTTSAGPNRTELAGRILVGYSVGGVLAPKSCVRHMRANAYVGSLVDVPDDGKIRDARVSRNLLTGRASLTFTATLHAGRDAAELAWQNRVFGEQRIMWATGTIEPEANGAPPSDDRQGQRAAADSCAAASLGYHAGNRGLSSLNFPGTARACAA